MNCETVKVVKDNAKGYHIRNKSDLTDDDVIYKEGAQDNQGDDNDISKMKVDDLKAELGKREIKIPDGSKKPDLVKLLEDAIAAEGDDE